MSVPENSTSNKTYRLDDPARRRPPKTRRYKELIDAAKIVNSTLDLDVLLNLIAETALRNVYADRGTLYLIDVPRRELWSRVLNDPALQEIRLPLGRGIAGHVAVTGDTINLSDAYKDPRFDSEFDNRTGYRTKSMLCMPLRNRNGKVIGVFQFLNKKRGNFTPRDVGFIEALSVHAALAVENARLYADERKRIELESDLIAAREVQRSLLPRLATRIGKFTLAAFSLPAAEVGGDYFDCIQLDNDYFEIIIADVVGKGLAAALLGAVGKGIFYSQAPGDRSPSAHLKKSNHILRQHLARKVFITALDAIFDSRKMTVVLSNAGHCLPLLYRKSTLLAEVLNVRGIALNFADELSCGDHAVTLMPGDTLVLYSDGISEARNPAGDMFGVEGLQSVIGGAAQGNPEEQAAAVKDALARFTDGAEANDDMTLIVVKAGL